MAKKFSVLMLIVVAVRIYVLLSTNYVRDKELISILENDCFMGIQLLKGLKSTILKSDATIVTGSVHVN